MYKFSFEIEEDQRRRADKIFEMYGIRRAIFSPILDEVMDMIDEYGHVVLAVLLDKDTKPREIIPSLAKVEKLAKK